MTTQEFFREIRQKVANDQLEETVGHLRTFLENSPSLGELRTQSNRFDTMIAKIRQKDLDFDQTSRARNELRQNLLDFIKDLELKTHTTQIHAELQEATSITTSKNVVVDSTIHANDVHIGDVKTYSESKQSKRLRLFLFVFVPLIVVISSILYYQLKVMSKPLNMKVLLENKTPNDNLPDQSGSLTIIYGGEEHKKQSVTNDAIFENIPSNFKDEEFQLKYEAEGFVPIDTSFNYNEVIKISVRRNDQYSVIQGYVYEENTDPLQGLENVRVTIACCSALTDETGHFRLEIPFEFQLKKQRLEFFKEGFHQKSTIEPVIKNVELQTYLVKR
jgi:hypothetical protein